MYIDGTTGKMFEILVKNIEEKNAKILQLGSLASEREYKIKSLTRDLELVNQELTELKYNVGNVQKEVNKKGKPKAIPVAMSYNRKTGKWKEAK